MPTDPSNETGTPQSLKDGFAAAVPVASFGWDRPFIVRVYEQCVYGVPAMTSDLTTPPVLNELAGAQFGHRLLQCVAMD